VVDCYRALGRLSRAETLVRQRLAVKETPNMWAALGKAHERECGGKRKGCCGTSVVGSRGRCIP